MLIALIPFAPLGLGLACRGRLAPGAYRTGDPGYRRETGRR
jgi:hypothetical protein